MCEEELFAMRVVKLVQVAQRADGYFITGTFSEAIWGCE